MISKIILSGGCFWGTQAVFEDLKGILNTTVGYIGGRIKHPKYKDVCTGQTGHAESVEIVYDTQGITLSEILEIFFMTHDPTTLNRQGPDFGTQYRSGIYYFSRQDLPRIRSKIKEVSTYFNSPVVTEVKKAPFFWIAEEVHQHYFKKHGCKKNKNAEINKEHFLQRKLSAEQYWIMRGRGTEAPFSGKYIYQDKKGVYSCAACGQKLFSSRHKFLSASGWPSFDQALEDTITIQSDFSHFMIRDEVSCNRCGSHLGHLFNDGPTRTKLRYCINSAALDFMPQK